jgi:hypothetical protein
MDFLRICLTKAIFRLLDKNENIIGILAVNLNDTIGGVTPTFYAIMEEVARDLKEGSTEPDCFHYKGLRISTVDRNGGNSGFVEIIVDGDEYSDSAYKMTVPAGQPASALSPASATDFRSVVGCLGHMVSSFRPYLSL